MYKTAKQNRTQKKRGNVILPIAIVLLVGYYLLYFVVGSNFRQVVPDKVYRSAQPSISQLEKWVSRYGIKTVINLRGDAGEITKAEQNLANQLGINFITIRLKAHAMPDPNTRRQLINALETAQQPILLHCQAGVDRSGTASAIAAMALGNETYEKARWQAYVPTGPWKRKERKNYTHISDILRFYERYCQRNNLDTNGWEQFKKWTLDSNSLADADAKYQFTCGYLPKLSNAERFYPLSKLLGDAGTEFALELTGLALFAVVIFRKVLNNPKQ